MAPQLLILSVIISLKQRRCGLTKYLKEGEMLARLVAADNSIVFCSRICFYTEAKGMDPDQTAPKGAI